MHLRYLTTLHEISNEKTSTIVFPFPMDLKGVFERLTGPRGDGQGN